MVCGERKCGSVTNLSIFCINVSEMLCINLVFQYVLSKYFVQCSKEQIIRLGLVTTNQSSKTTIMINNIDSIIIFFIFVSELAEDGLYSHSS